MSEAQIFQEFRQNFKLLARKNKKAVINTLSNVFTMRMIGNKTHGDLAEIAISEFINQFMYNYSSKHVGKDLFRAKEHEEDILVTHELTNEKIPISLKAYGVGPLQLSTDREGKCFPSLKKLGKVIESRTDIQAVFQSAPFESISKLNILPLIYDEQNKKCNIMFFDVEKSTEENC